MGAGYVAIDQVRHELAGGSNRCHRIAGSIRVGPHLHGQRPTVAHGGQRPEHLLKRHNAGAEWHSADGPGQAVLHVYGNQVAVTERQLRHRIVAGCGHVGHVRVDLEPQRVNLTHDRHAARQRFGQWDVHVFQRKHDTGLAGQFRRPAQSIHELSHSAVVTFLVEDIVAGDLDDAHSYIRCKLDRLAHDRLRPLAHLR